DVFVETATQNSFFGKRVPNKIKLGNVIVVSQIFYSSVAGFVGRFWFCVAIVDCKFFKIGNNRNWHLGTPSISANLISRGNVVFYGNAWFFCFQKEKSFSSNQSERI